MDWVINWIGSGVKRWWLDFDGDSSYADCGADASLEDLPGDSGFTIDCWIKVPDEQLAHYGTIASKYDTIQEVSWGWYFVIDYDTATLGGVAIFQTIPAGSNTNQMILVEDWTHVLMCFNPVDAKLYIAIDGAWCTYSVQTAAVGVIGTDASIPFLMGALLQDSAPTSWLRGGIQWLRLSTGVRYEIGVEFIPPDMCPPPDVDGITIEIWALDEGTGPTLHANVHDPTNNGTMTDYAWYACEEEE